MPRAGSGPEGAARPARRPRVHPAHRDDATPDDGRRAGVFQYLTQAATKIDRCAVVASLLASEPGKSDTLGKEIAPELFTIFRREREEGIQPVLKEDVAEVLRRRFFVPESIKDREAFRSHVVAALKGVTDHDDATIPDSASS